VIVQCQVTGHFIIRCEKGLSVITFYFYQTDHFESRKKSFFLSKFSVKFEKFAKFDFFKIYHNFSNNILFIASTEITATYSHRMKPKHLSPLTTHCPITGPSPHMRQLLDSDTWHQQQLKQLAAFLTPQHSVVYFTAGINSLLHRNT
jgi:hypothetical protein